jgi:GTP-binding protein
VLLFLIPADAKDVKKEYKILLKELKKFNPELLLKQRVIAISKSDLLDEELKKELAKETKSLQPIFFSAVSLENIQGLKDKLWDAIQKANEG